MDEKKYSTEDMYKYGKEKFKDGETHSKPSSDTLMMFNKMNEQMNDKMDNLKNGIYKLGISIAKIPEKILEKTDLRYANKGRVEAMEKRFEKIEKLIRQLLVGIAICFLGFLTQLVILVISKL